MKCPISAHPPTPHRAGYNPAPDAPPVEYTVVGSPASITFGVFSALGTIAFGFGDTLLPEIQATLGEPVKRGMYKAVSLCYAVISSTYLMTTIAGYWVRGARPLLQQRCPALSRLRAAEPQKNCGAPDPLCLHLTLPWRTSCCRRLATWWRRTSPPALWAPPGRCACPTSSPCCKSSAATRCADCGGAAAARLERFVSIAPRKHKVEKSSGSP